jgi:hypothetical protein
MLGQVLQGDASHASISRADAQTLTPLPGYAGIVRSNLVGGCALVR